MVFLTFISGLAYFLLATKTGRVICLILARVCLTNPFFWIFYIVLVKKFIKD